jgi:hypothetical protein
MDRSLFVCLIGISLMRACTVRGPIFPPKESLRDWKKGGNPVFAFVACFEMGEAFGLPCVIIAS